MIRKIWIINLTLAVVALSVFFTAYRFWHKSTPTATGQKIRTESDTAQIPRIEKKNILGENSYSIIEKNNLFSPERKASVKNVKPETIKVEKVQEEATPLYVRQKYTLYAVILKNEDARALIQAPVQDKKAKPMRWVSVNEKIDDFTVSEISKDKVYIQNSTDKYAIPLYKMKDKNTPSAPTVIKEAEREAPKVISTQSSMEEKAPTEAKKTGDEVIDGKYKIVETPFGKSRIRIK